MSEQAWFDAEGAATYLNVPVSTVARLIRDGLLDGKHSPVRLRRQDLDACIERCRIKSGDLAYASRPGGRPGEPPITSKGRPDRRYRPRHDVDDVDGLGRGS